MQRLPPEDKMHRQERLQKNRRKHRQTLLRPHAPKTHPKAQLRPQNQPNTLTNRGAGTGYTHQFHGHEAGKHQRNGRSK